MIPLFNKAQILLLSTLLLLALPRRGVECFLVTFPSRPFFLKRMSGASPLFSTTSPSRTGFNTTENNFQNIPPFYHHPQGHRSFLSSTSTKIGSVHNSTVAATSSSIVDEQGRTSFVRSLNQVMDHGLSKGIIHNTARHEIDDEGSTRFIEIDGKQMINFGSCSYLGLETHPFVIEGALSATRKYGTQFSTSRSFLSTELYERLEYLLGSIYSQPVLVAASTTLGHIAALPVLVGDNDAVILDMQVHASVQTASQLLKARGIPITTIRHNDMASLEKKVVKLKSKHNKVWYLADGLYSMLGDEAPLPALMDLLDKYEQFHLYIDDAHGTGWTGENGSGIVRKHMEHHHEKMVMTASLSKSFGAAGGAIVFANEAQKHLVRSCGGTFIFSGPIQPPMLGAACASAELHLRSSEIQGLQANLLHLIRYCNLAIETYNLPQYGQNESPIFFIPVGQLDLSTEIVRRVMNDGYYLNIAGYPAVPMNKSGIRFMMNLHLTSTDVDNLMKSIRRNYKDVLLENGIKESDLANILKVPSFQLPWRGQGDEKNETPRRTF